MSEIVTDSGADSAPTSTADVASDVIDAFDATETTGGHTETPSGDPPREQQDTPATEGAPVETPAKEPSEVEALLHKAGFTEPRRSDGRENRIPYSKVVKIIENGLKEGKGEFGARYQTLETEAQTLRGQIERLRAGVAGDTRQFLEEIASVDPRYRAFLEQQAAPVAPEPVAEMPQPDIRLADGSTTYSLAGIQKLLDWKDAQLEKKFDAKLQPLAERERQAQQRQQAEHVRQQLADQTRAQITDAQTWPGFADHEDAILKALQDDSAAAQRAGRRPMLSLEGAYRQVVIPTLAAERNKVREDVLKELNGAARSTAVPRAGSEAPRTPSGASTADIAARTLARLEGAGR